ncbi:unnamed protein product [marine sediment metagenome]|uniref:Uncharacterized protein n=1 Tax=marine sediment metagenome TaxID=412755 RepID=X1HTU7_9ZZZZ
MKDLDTMRYEKELNMSNHDHSIDEGLEEWLKENEGKVCAQHAAWDFCGYVWYELGKFYEQVWQHNSPIEEISADTLEELMTKANDKYGYD